MHFLFTLCAAIVCFSSGAAILSLACIILAQIAAMVSKHSKTHRTFIKKRPYRLTLALLMLSCTVASTAVAIIFVPRIGQFFPLAKADVVYYVCLFAVGGIAALFPKIVFPVLAVLYTALCVFTFAILEKEFGMKSTVIPVSVSETAVSVGKEVYAIQTVPKKSQMTSDQEVTDKSVSSLSILFTVYTLPDKLLVPLPRTWYFPSGATTISYVSSSDTQKTSAVKQLTPEKTASLLPNKKQRASMCSFFYQYLFSRCSISVSPLPPSAVYPALYTITASRHLTDISFNAVRSF